MRGRAAAVAAFGLLALPTAAGAFYGNGAKIVSADLVRLEQGDELTQFADIAAIGRYVVFQTRARNFFADDDPDPPGRYRQGGIFRRDLVASGPLLLVAGGDQRDEDDNTLVVRGAQNPAVSSSGRFVAFSTGEALVPEDTNAHVDVYVRDMALPATDPEAFDIVSARSATTTPASYEPRPEPLPGIDAGSEVTRGVSISDDGRYVLFRTMAASDLPAAAGTTTAAGQLFRRDRNTNATTLVTRTASAGEPAGGALGAALSADGTTAVWTGRSAVAQTPFLSGESPADVAYYLWQRIADGPTAPTRRITGQVDLDDPDCAPGSIVIDSPTPTGPCYGPLTSTENTVSANIANLVPTLSGDGRRVVYQTGAGPRPNTLTPDGIDVWVTDMSAGVSRKSGSTELTREATATDAAIENPVLSPDGRYLAFVTLRNTFPLTSSLRLVGTARSTATVRELYVADLSAKTLERVVRGVDGGEISAGIDGQPSISTGGDRLAFVSSASNLFFGDANERADAFSVARTAEPPDNPPPAAGGGGGTDTEQRDPDTPGALALPVKAKVLKGGVVDLTVTAPGVGGIKATARAGVGKRRRTATVATGTGRARKAGRLKIRLRIVKRYRSELRRRAKILARVNVSYVASRGGRRANRSFRVTFRQKLPRSTKKR